MSVRSLLKNSRLLTSIVTASLLAAALFIAVPKASADDCQKRILKADHHLHEAVEHHGYQSSQAEHARHELAEARAWCWDHSHRWWDVDGNRWHTEHDWDDHDHDHLYDHH